MIGLLLALALHLAAAEPTGPSPPLVCVELLRSARLAEELDQVVTALERRLEASERCPAELAPKLELLSYYRRHGRTQEAAAMGGTLVAWLADPARPLHPSALGYLANYPALGDEERSALLGALVTRLERRAGTAAEMETAARLALALDRREQARELFGRLLMVEPSLHLRECIELDRALGRWADVVRGLEAIVAGGETSPHVSMAYIEALAKVGRYDDLLAQLHGLRRRLHDTGTLRQLEPRLHELERQIAWDLRDLGRDEQSEQVLRTIVEQRPGDVEARAALFHYYTSEEERLAQERSREAASRSASEPYELLDRGGRLLAEGDARAAVELLRRAVESLPDSETAWFNLGLTAFQLERWEEAERALARAIEINSGRAASFLNRGAALSKLQRCAEAIPVLDRALELQADLHQAHFYLYACHTLLGDKKKSEKALQRYNESR